MKSLWQRQGSWREVNLAKGNVDVERFVEKSLWVQVCVRANSSNKGTWAVVVLLVGGCSQVFFLLCCEFHSVGGVVLGEIICKRVGPVGCVKTEPEVSKAVGAPVGIEEGTLFLCVSVCRRAASGAIQESQVYCALLLALCLVL